MTTTAARLGLFVEQGLEVGRGAVVHEGVGGSRFLSSLVAGWWTIRRGRLVLVREQILRLVVDEEVCHPASCDGAIIVAWAKILFLDQRNPCAVFLEGYDQGILQSDP